VEDEVEAGLVGVGGDEDVAADLAVELGEHPLELRVEEVGSLREVARALAVDAVHGQLRRHAPDQPRAGDHHAPGPELVQPLLTHSTVAYAFLLASLSSRRAAQLPVAGRPVWCPFPILLCLNKRSKPYTPSPSS
jgi:hypothetical protein